MVERDFITILLTPCFITSIKVIAILPPISLIFSVMSQLSKLALDKMMNSKISTWTNTEY